MTLLSCVFMSLPSKAPGILPCLLRSGKSHSFLLPCSCSPCSSCRQSLCPQCCRVESERLPLSPLPAFAALCGCAQPPQCSPKGLGTHFRSHIAQSVPDTGCAMAGEVPRVQSLGLLSFPYFLYVYCCLLFKTVPCYVTQLTLDPFSPQLPKITGIHPA